LLTLPIQTLGEMMFKKLVLIAMVMLGTASMALAQLGENVTYIWTAPTTGTPVVNYVVQISIDGAPYEYVGDAASETYTFYAEALLTYQIRVAGVDAQDRQGPYSVASDPLFLDYGAPGEAGKPVRVGG